LIERNEKDVLIARDNPND